MSNEDYSINKDQIQIWENHEELKFKSTSDMLVWVSDDKVNFKLSDKVYDAMIYCLENEIEQIIVSTISVENQSIIDVVIRKQNFQKILSAYIERLLNAEKYEKLAEIKQQIQKYNLEM